MARKNLYPPSVTPGIPKLGQKPAEWVETTFGDVLQVIQRRVKMDDSKEYQLVIAKRSRGGIVPRSILTGFEILTKTQFYINTLAIESLYTGQEVYPRRARRNTKGKTKNLVFLRVLRGSFNPVWLWLVQVRSGDFLISRRQIIHGACGVVPPELDGAIVSNEYSTLRIKEGLLLEFLKYFSHTIFFQQTCFQASVGVDVEKMIFNLTDWLKYKIYLPPISEQRKIAEILYSWDETITLTERLIAAKQRRKKVLMQQLLTGRRRFWEFEGKRWHEVKLGNVAKLTAGGTPSTSVPEYWGGDIPWMKSGEVNLKRVYAVAKRITQVGLKNSGTKLIPKNSILIALAGQGKTRGTVAINKIELCTNQSIAAIMPNSKILYYEYLFYNLDSRYDELRRLSSGEGGRGGLNLQILEGVKLVVPPLEEQRKIAAMLQACDEEIEILGQKLAALKRQKKGLMQKLLTGRVRVKAG